MPELVDQYVKGELKVDEFISHTLPLTEINTAFDLMHQGLRYFTQTHKPQEVLHD